MTDLDPKGLEAAYKAYGHGGRERPSFRAGLRAYLRATTPEDVTALVEAARPTLDALKAHHDWHQQEDVFLDMGPDCEPLSVGSCYVDSTLEERTTAAIIGLRNALDGTGEEGDG